MARRRVVRNEEDKPQVDKPVLTVFAWETPFRSGVEAEPWDAGHKQTTWAMVEAIQARQQEARR